MCNGWLATLAMGVFLVACGEAREGETCDTPGATEEECWKGSICGKYTADAEELTCLRTCIADAECWCSGADWCEDQPAQPRMSCLEAFEGGSIRVCRHE